MMQGRGSQIVYFDGEGRDNLPSVLRVVKKALKKREDLRSLKLVIFTSFGEGPLLAYNELSGFDLRIVAVTFPIDFCVKRQDGSSMFPRIPPKLLKFFSGVEIKVLSPAPLPFDQIENLEFHNQQMKTIRQAISIFGGGFTLCLQAVIRACDAGEVGCGERVLAMSGDCAAIVTASTTSGFLGSGGLAVNEILCKPHNLTMVRSRLVPAEVEHKTIDGVVPSSGD